MKYRLRVSISRDEDRWTWEEFYEEQRIFYETIVEQFSSYNPKIEDWYVELSTVTTEPVSLLRELCEYNGYQYELWAVVKYLQKEIRNARFVPLLTECGPLDSDREGVPLNKYEAIVCEACGRCDESQVPNPYRINRKVMKRPPDIFRASNGIVVLSERAFALLWDDLKRSVSSGDVVIYDKGQSIPCSVKYKWVFPNIAVGPFVDAKVLKRCNKCGQPVEIRQQRLKDIFGANKCTVETFKGVQAPIALAGNWYGEIEPGSPCDNYWAVFISGAFHEKIRKLKLKGFVKADYVVHSADEPYDWDPLKDYKPITSDCSR
jgi:hypothetical protein